jgi:hypothetical protein
MKLRQIQKQANAMGVSPEGLDKVALIKQMQLHEGNFDCFATATMGICDQMECGWREDCLAMAAPVRRVS